MEDWLAVLVVLVMVGLPFVAFYLWLKTYGGPDGERLQKFRMQGPFVPLREAEIEEDAERVRERRDPHERTGTSDPSGRSD